MVLPVPLDPNLYVDGDVIRSLENTPVGAQTIEELEGDYASYTNVYNNVVLDGSTLGSPLVHDDGTVIFQFNNAGNVGLEWADLTGTLHALVPVETYVTNSGATGGRSSFGLTYSAATRVSDSRTVDVIKGTSILQTIIPTISGGVGNVVQAYFSPSGKYLVLINSDGDVELWAGISQP